MKGELLLLNNALNEWSSTNLVEAATGPSETAADADDLRPVGSPSASRPSDLPGRATMRA